MFERKEERREMTAATPPSEIRVIPWEKEQDIWGVTYRRANGTRPAYRVGDKAVAENEANSVAQGNPPLFGPDAAKPKLE
jgi:hypothetical protein